ncbi:hypothetical protein [Micromonospora sp. NPDC049891]|uniref:hypothetical protein n=1 Tax=Micromonospora sp. NPDC049891 TaxID=3155655 RepID=UPI00340CFF81
MPTLDELIRDGEAKRAEAVERRERARTDARLILARAERDGRTHLTVEEEAKLEARAAARAKADADIKDIDATLAHVYEARDEERKIEADQRTTYRTAAQPQRRLAYDGVARIGAEERTYNPGNDRTGSQFVRDVARQFLFNDPGAQQRLARHAREEQVERGAYLEQRAVGTGAFGGLVVPQYLTDLYAPAIANMRPLANAANTHPLPADGMQVNISRITTATSVALQASENTAVSETNADDTLLTINVQTAAGQQTISRQAVERGTGVEDVVMDDLLRRYASEVDRTMITQASTGLSAVAQNTAYTDADPTAPELWPIIFQAQSKLEQALGGMVMPDYVVMHPRRWNWLCAQVGTSWPFIGTAQVPAQSGGIQLVTDQGPGVRGILSNGLRVIVDANVPTTTGGSQDEIYVVASREMHLWEDPNAPVFIRAEQAAASTLGVLLVCYGYFAYTFGRYTNNPGKISGTGLAAPAGF